MKLLLAIPLMLALTEVEIREQLESNYQKSWAQGFRTTSGARKAARALAKLLSDEFRQGNRYAEMAKVGDNSTAGACPDSVDLVLNTPVVVAGTWGNKMLSEGWSEINSYTIGAAFPGKYKVSWAIEMNSVDAGSGEEIRTCVQTGVSGVFSECCQGYWFQTNDDFVNLSGSCIVDMGAETVNLAVINYTDSTDVEVCWANVNLVEID